MRIKAVANAARVSEQTIRFYERSGVLPPPARSPNGYRDYPADTIALVRFIKRAQELGFSLADARAMSDLRGAPGPNRTAVRAIAETKLHEVEQRITDLAAISEALRQLIKACGENTEPRCPILEALGSPSPDSASAAARSGVEVPQ